MHVARFCAELRASNHVKTWTKKRTDDELLREYGLVDGTLLTNLGVRLVGRPSDRERVGPVVRAIKYEDALPKGLGRLVKLGIIERVGRGQTGHYVVARSLLHEYGVGYQLRTIR